jgi:4-amino-4-deoxy-L-arabinose transferase-like glycosyltransferase
MRAREVATTVAELFLNRATVDLKFLQKHIGAACLIALVLVGSSFLMLYRLGVQPLHNDEARYAEVVTESFLQSHQYFSLVYRGEPYFNKPPLLFWLVDVSHVFVKDMQTAVRLPSAIGVILLLIATMLVVFEATGSLYGAAFGGAVLATTPSLVLLARSGRFDSLATLFVVLATYSFIRAFKDRRWFLLFGACIGLAVITKGPVVLFAGVAVLAASWAHRRFDWLRAPYFWGGVGVALLIALPWHIYETYLFGGEFWNAYVWQQIVERAQTNIVSIALPLTNWNYITYFFEYLAPWSTLFIGGLVLTPFLWSSFSTKARLFLLASLAEIASVLLVCFVMQSKAYRYLIPFYPFMAISLAIIMWEVSRLEVPHLRPALVTGFVSLGLFAFAWSAYNGFLLNPNYPYSTDTPASAHDEQQVADILLARHANQFYVYNTADIGGIMYYSHLIDPYYFPLYGYYPGLYFVLPVKELGIFKDSHPLLGFSILYEGADLILGQELGKVQE